MGFRANRPVAGTGAVHLFSIKKQQPAARSSSSITVKEFITPKEPTMHFFAQADKQTNQAHGALSPSGWGKTMLEALSECVRAINRFPYEGK